VRCEKKRTTNNFPSFDDGKNHMRRRRVCLTFEEEIAVHDQLREVAKADAGRSVSSVLRAAVREYLARHRRDGEASAA